MAKKKSAKHGHEKLAHLRARGKKFGKEKHPQGKGRHSHEQLAHGERSRGKLKPKKRMMPKPPKPKPKPAKRAKHPSLKRRIEDLEILFDKLFSKVSEIDHRVDITDQALRGLRKLGTTASEMSSALESIEARSSKTEKSLDKMQTAVVGIAQHAKNIEAAHQDAKFAAQDLAEKTKELTEITDHLFKQMELLNNKLNANISALSDLSIAVDALKNRLFAVEQHRGDIAQLSALLERNSEAVEQLARRLAYLEKVTAKTIVLG